jgi:hypothetical protein
LLMQWDESQIIVHYHFRHKLENSSSPKKPSVSQCPLGVLCVAWRLGVNVFVFRTPIHNHFATRPVQ